MKTSERDYGFSSADLAELDRRMAEIEPEYASDEEVAALFMRTTEPRR